jgi:hypothetical protein
VSHIYNFRDFHGINITNDVFIETGTSQGVTLKHAMQAGFNALHSIEIDPATFAATRADFGQWPHVNLYLGCAADILPRIIDRSRGTTFWLDAHTESLSHPGTKLSDAWTECSVLGELDAIFAERWSTPPIVLIDDAHILLDRKTQDCADPNAWPTLEELCLHLPDGYRAARFADVLLFIHESDYSIS